MLMWWVFWCALILGITSVAFAREGDDHGNHGALKSWFDHLRTKQGLCCSFADGETLTDVQWDTKDGHYRVFLDNRWIDVPDDAVIMEANRYGSAVVWPNRYSGGVVSIRCFIPGAGT
jgi:hypothetical protein